MADQTEMNDLLAAWHALAGKHDCEGWKTIPVSTKAPCLLLAGKKFPGNEEALLVGFRKLTKNSMSIMPQGHGFEVSLLSSAPTHGDRSWIALSRRPNASFDLFAKMAEDLLRFFDNNSSQDEHMLLSLFLSRIRAWQDFMDRHRAGVLSADAELGLVGELTILHEMLQAGMSPRKALESWQGPLNGLQDFMLESGSIEVKSTLSSTRFNATISSLEQLDDTMHGPIILAALRFANDDGMTLPEHISAIQNIIESNKNFLEIFNIRLLHAGYVHSNSEKYTRLFQHKSTSLFMVNDKFPRLIRNNIHYAIFKARYEIDLELVECSKLDLLNTLKFFGAIS